MEDEQTIRLFEERSTEAIEQTKSQYGALCRSLAGKLPSREEDVEECVNDTYLALWDTIPPAKPSPLSAYIAKVTRNLALKRLEHLTVEKRNTDAVLSFDELDACLRAPGGPDHLPAAVLLFRLRKRDRPQLRPQRKQGQIQPDAHTEQIKSVSHTGGIYVMNGKDLSRQFGDLPEEMIAEAMLPAKIYRKKHTAIRVLRVAATLEELNTKE